MFKMIKKHILYSRQYDIKYSIVISLLLHLGAVPFPGYPNLFILLLVKLASARVKGSPPYPFSHGPSAS